MRPDNLRKSRGSPVPIMELTVKRLTASPFSRFRTSERGAILVEALLIVPIITLFALAVIEFGFLFWERQQVQSGVRDAARYWSRCSASAHAASACNVDKAKSIATAYFDQSANRAYLRLPNWFSTDVKFYPVIKGAANSSLCPPDKGNEITTATAPPASPTADDRFVVITEFPLGSTPLGVLASLPGITMSYSLCMRYIGW